MKRINRRLLAVVVSSAMVLPMAAPVQADEGLSLYGSLRYGVVMVDDGVKDTDRTVNLGSNRSSRWGIKGSMDAGGGMTAGLKMERAVGGVSTKGRADNGNLKGTMSARHHHVYLSGGFGTFTFGQQDAPYYGATTWDGSQTLGGLTDPYFRSSGVSYASNLGGPFGFKLLVGSGASGAEAASDGANHLQASASLAAGMVTMNLGLFRDKDGVERIGGTVGGNLAGLNWKAGADTGSDSCGAGCDDDRFGFHVGYALTEAGNAYVQYSDSDSDADAADTSGWVAGYRHILAPGVVAYAETGMTDAMNDDAGEEVTATTMVAALKISF